MNQYLVDTSAISAFSPNRSQMGDRKFDWSLRTQAHWYLPTIVFMEIEQGLQKLARMGATNKHAHFAAWRGTLLETYSEKLVTLDVESAMRAGVMNETLRAQGRSPGVVDILIAAIAATRGMIVLTCNLRHFELTGVPALDPFDTEATRYLT